VTGVTAFSGRYAFLSDWYPAPTQVYDRTYLTLAHAHYAARFARVQDRHALSEPRMSDYAEVVRYAERAPLRADWPEVWRDVYWYLLHDKFTRNSMLRDLLCSTDPQPLLAAAESPEQGQFLTALRDMLWTPPF
jgi:predicted NAD-dependent protein-ADP-ribosyltransferase YbiA (DUF1768 family)